MDSIIMENMRFSSFSGVLPEEKKNGQIFVVSLVLEIPQISGCKSDNIRDTVDYGKVYAMVKDYVEQVSCNLIEYMAEQIIVRILRSFSMVEKVTCEIKKPQAPIDGDFDYMSVRIGRSRMELEEAL